MGRPEGWSLITKALGEPISSDQHKIADVFMRAAALCLRKNADYGSSFRRAPALAPGVSAQDAVLVRIDDKDRRFAKLHAQAQPGEVREPLGETVLDAACYRLLWCLLEEERVEGLIQEAELAAEREAAEAPGEPDWGLAEVRLLGIAETSPKRLPELFASLRRRYEGGERSLNLFTAILLLSELQDGDPVASEGSPS